MGSEMCIRDRHWMRAFVLMGLIERRGVGWVKLRDPSEDDLALTRQQADQPYASSATVLDWLESRELEAPERTLSMTAR